MKKVIDKKLVLARTTVQVLTERRLAGSAGGMINNDSQDTNCSVTCHLTNTKLQSCRGC